jgi:hypothetical protein
MRNKFLFAIIAISILVIVSSTDVRDQPGSGGQTGTIMKPDLILEHMRLLQNQDDMYENSDDLEINYVKQFSQTNKKFGKNSIIKQTIVPQSPKSEVKKFSEFGFIQKFLSFFNAIKRIDPATIDKFLNTIDSIVTPDESNKPVPAYRRRRRGAPAKYCSRRRRRGASKNYCRCDAYKNYRRRGASKNYCRCDAYKNYRRRGASDNYCRCDAYKNYRRPSEKASKRFEAQRNKAAILIFPAKEKRVHHLI